MLLGGYELAILVDDSALPEYTCPAYATSVPTGSSYVRNGNCIVESEMNHFVATPGTGVSYKVRITASSATMETPIRADLYIDGKHDHKCKFLQSPLPETQSQFWSQNKEETFTFKFSETVWGEGPTETLNYGGPGAVSVYFYRASICRTSVHPTMGIERSISLDQITVEESKTMKGIEVSTKFERQTALNVKPPSQQHTTVKKLDKQPLAVLHLHYRPMSWIIMQTPLHTPERTHSSLHRTGNEFVTPVTVKSEGKVSLNGENGQPAGTSRGGGGGGETSRSSMQDEREMPEVIEIPDSDNDDDDYKHKRRFRQEERVIIISDSDNDDEHIDKRPKTEYVTTD